MAKQYWVTYAFDVPAYGSVWVEAESDEAVIDEVKRLHNEDKLIAKWKTNPDVGCENYRVVAIEKDNSFRQEGQYVSDGFSLEEEKANGDNTG
jgi:hypothetical protein